MWTYRTSRMWSIGITLTVAAFLSWGAPLQAEEDVSAPVPSAASSAAGPEATKVQAQEAYGRLPLAFEVNQGQSDPQVRFLARGSKQTIFLTPAEAVFALRGGKTDHPHPLRTEDHHRDIRPQPTSVLRLRWVGAPYAPITGTCHAPYDYCGFHIG